MGNRRALFDSQSFLLCEPRPVTEKHSKTELQYAEAWLNWEMLICFHLSLFSRSQTANLDRPLRFPLTWGVWDIFGVWFTPQPQVWIAPSAFPLLSTKQRQGLSCQARNLTFRWPVLGEVWCIWVFFLCLVVSHAKALRQVVRFSNLQQ